MARIHGRITRSYNKRHCVFGPSWQGRYRARLIQKSDDLRNLLAYIHLNPVTAGLEDDPANWEFSGHRAIIGCGTPLLINMASALRCFEAESTEKARQIYFDYVRNVAEAKWARSAIRKLPWWRKARDDHQTVPEEDAPAQARTFDDKYPNLPAARIGESVEKLLERAAPRLGVSSLEIVGPLKQSATVAARRRFTLIAARFFRHSLKAIGVALNKNQAQVGRWLASETEAYYTSAIEAEIIDGVSSALLLEQQPDEISTSA